MTHEKIRWGILSTANIARKNWKAIYHSGNGIITAVSSRSVERSRQFIAECQSACAFENVPRALGSYEELLAAKDVDAVYIPLPTGLRKEWVIRAAQAGKHIVCEKPCANSVEDLREMLEACRRHRVQFMDGVMFMHSARLPRMREVLNDGASVGDIKRITSAFSFCAPPEFFTANIRASGELERFGCLGDLGWYCIRLALWTMNWQMPRSATGRIISRSGTGPASAPATAVPTEFSGELLFDGGVSSGFYCSFCTHNEQWACISGTKGYLRLADFVVPFLGSESVFDVNHTTHSANGLEARWSRESVPAYSNGHPTAQEANMFRNFTEQVRKGTLNELWPEMALKTQQVMEECFRGAIAPAMGSDAGSTSLVR